MDEEEEGEAENAEEQGEDELEERESEIDDESGENEYSFLTESDHEVEEESKEEV